jgi:hypothetical protein
MRRRREGTAQIAKSVTKTQTHLKTSRRLPPLDIVKKRNASGVLIVRRTIPERGHDELNEPAPMAIRKPASAFAAG